MLQPLRGCGWGVKYGFILFVFFHPLLIPYSHSTPTGLGPSTALPQVAPVAIHIQPLRGWGPPRLFHRLHLWLFIFNPYGVEALLPSPGSFLRLFIFRPLRGWRVDKLSTFIRYNQGNYTERCFSSSQRRRWKRVNPCYAVVIQGTTQLLEFASLDVLSK